MGIILKFAFVVILSSEFLYSGQFFVAHLFSLAEDRSVYEVASIGIDLVGQAFSKAAGRTIQRICISGPHHLSRPAVGQGDQQCEMATLSKVPSII